MLCGLANISRSGYYKWLAHADLPDKDHDDYLKIKTVFDQGKGRYGWRSIKMRLKAMNHKKIQRIMRKNAPIESFFGHMKDELDYKGCTSFEEMRLKIDEYMRYYNNKRKQWTKKRMTPVEYRNHLLASLG